MTEDDSMRGTDVYGQCDDIMANLEAIKMGLQTPDISRQNSLAEKKNTSKK